MIGTFVYIEDNKTSTVLASTTDAGDIASLKALIADETRGWDDQNGRVIRIVAVGKDYARFVDENRAKPVEYGQLFKSARSLSVHMGLNQSAVANALSVAKRKKEFRADLRGVEFEYADDD